jgi:hypothetical protein
MGKEIRGISDQELVTELVTDRISDQAGRSPVLSLAIVGYVPSGHYFFGHYFFRLFRPHGTARGLEIKGWIVLCT